MVAILCKFDKIKIIPLYVLAVMVMSGALAGVACGQGLETEMSSPFLLRLSASFLPRPNRERV